MEKNKTRGTQLLSRQPNYAVAKWESNPKDYSGGRPLEHNLKNRISYNKNHKYLNPNKIIQPK